MFRRFDPDGTGTLSRGQVRDLVVGFGYDIDDAYGEPEAAKVITHQGFGTTSLFLFVLKIDRVFRVSSGYDAVASVILLWRRAPRMPLRHSRVWPPPPPPLVTVSHVMEMFGEMDADGNGLIDYSEFGALWEQLAPPEVKAAAEIAASAAAATARASAAAASALGGFAAAARTPVVDWVDKARKSKDARLPQHVEVTPDSAVLIGFQCFAFVCWREP